MLHVELVLAQDHHAGVPRVISQFLFQGEEDPGWDDEDGYELPLQGHLLDVEAVDELEIGVFLCFIGETVPEHLHALELAEFCVNPDEDVLGGGLAEGGGEEGLLDDGAHDHLSGGAGTFGEWS